MKVLMQIGQEYWIAPDFATAAKVADLVAKCKPVAREYFPHITPNEAYYPAPHGAWPHEVEVKTIADELVVTAKEHAELVKRNEQAKT